MACFGALLLLFMQTAAI